MQPLKLKLEGFNGIKSGRGKNSIEIDFTQIPKHARLIALDGPNGAGKTTILDNMHPFRVMPSHSTTLGPGGFSYWDHVSGSLAQKELVWMARGMTYKSSLVFKSTGKTQRTEAYLMYLDASGQWQPYRLKDGTSSDGRTASYDLSVEEIIGPPECFFTSNFSAQNRKPLSAYGPSEIKSLMSSILNLGNYEELAMKATAVVKMLHLNLEEVQSEVAKAAVIDDLVAAKEKELAAADEKIQAAVTLEATRQSEVDGRKRDLILIEGRREAQASEAQEARLLNQSITKFQSSAEEQISVVKQQGQANHARVLVDRQRMQNDITEKSAVHQRESSEIKQLQKLVEQEPAITHAVQRSNEIRAEIQLVTTSLDKARAQVTILKPARRQYAELKAKESELATVGESTRSELQSVKARAILITEVPCQGQPMQSNCKLLANAMAAHDSLPAKEEEIAKMREKYRLIRDQVLACDTRIRELDQLETEIEAFESKKRSLETELRDLVDLASKQELLGDAKARLPRLMESKSELEAALQKLKLDLAKLVQDGETFIETEMSAISGIRERCEADIKPLQQRLATMSKPITDAEIGQAKSYVDAAIRILEEAKAAVLALRNQKIEAMAAIETLKVSLQALEYAKSRAFQLTEEIAKWNRIAKGFGNNGLVALTIDDAGPEISSLCNRLLDECYGGRFNVRLETQKETNAGTMRETFDVRVMDNHRGEEKSLFLMSGGEKVWVNECLARGISLYNDISKGGNPQTLFSDEADGPLDPERKRQFMKMKRAVMDSGNYEREFFITQTPELTAEADHIINVAAL
ncbi:AAA family ATPase [Herbaspirillum sp. CAH-3]|uniref:AAA family ATPase n=1 Tax=Herbaspirillum sp. CAH-3 TaxID=2605746 RepID=UPI0012AC8270|nr:AAA family ATPase [Herbaspirillum sp. CAH-3]MRT30999.1 AAA family ATPase [Herbaspirillum sp. CAH-3]